ncbi:hypothetical protein SeMB42_g02883 [Synchytrium endobioticum]|uniref:Uncharacterized protein n=1 Tax=Synchytrium endobioticum TaxID=286115 RepID=A0A507CKG1_9FUNG|nr:hypothetical protein SeLEV6574_g06730 [Synchytrium endobioticum]TPX48734.1 hypothetical protein SeMB42_g02883 [Synchytrium endobioticum]
MSEIKESLIPPSTAEAAPSPLKTLPRTIEEYLVASKSTDPSAVSKNDAPARIYLEDSVMPLLVEGLKLVVRERPPNPTEFLGMYLIRNSRAE